MHGRFSRSLTALIPVLAATLLASCDTGSPTGPRIVSLARVSGNEQAAPVGATLAAPLVIRAIDQNGVPIPGVALVWEVTSGGGAFIAASSSTDATGLGQAVFRLGNSLGEQEVSVRAGSQPPVSFTLQATTAPASQLRVSSGNNQNGTAGAALPATLVVEVVDAVNNPKAGVPVTFTVASGGGSLSTATVLSNASGTASVTWTLGTTAGAQTVVATSPGLPAVTFTALGAADAPTAIAIVSGNNQVASPGVALGQPLRVRLTDRFGNGVPGVPVTFSVGAADGSISPPSSLTNADGIAQGTWTLGPAGGLKLAGAAAGALSVTFTAGSTVSYASIGVGGRHTCAVSTDNVLYCWGYNGDGQLGLGAGASGSGPVYAVPQPSAVTGALSFLEVNSGSFHTCAWTLSFNPYCWGKNVDGRVGNGSLAQVNAPAHLSGANVFRRISGGGTHSCGITLADRVLCWGFARDGQVGAGVPAADVVSSPAEVSGDLRWGQVSAGELHSCGITNNGETYCWGVNLRGQIGDAGTADRFVPTVVAGGHSFVRVTAGGDHSCALENDGTAWCWGSNTFGQLGDGSVADATVPTLVAGGLTFESISAGLNYTCGVLGSPTLPGADPVGGAVYCWGRNQAGQLGDGSQLQRTVPTPIANGLAFLSVSTGDQTSCGITGNNLAFCWGDNQYGQIGDGTTIRRLVPTKVAFQP